MTTYSVEVKTGARDHAGTDANVYIQLIGAKGTSGEIELDNPEDNFEKGKTDTFHIQADDVGWIESIRIFHNNAKKNAGWYLDYVKVTNEDVGLSFKADFYRWLAKDEGDEQIDVTKPVPVGAATLSKGNIVSCFMGYNTIRKSNQSATTMNYNEAFSYQYKQGMSLKKTTGWSISAGAKISAEFFGLKCEFTTSVTHTTTSELSTSEEQVVQASSTMAFKLEPNQAITAVALYFQNILEGQASANGARMDFEEKFIIDADVVTFDGYLTDAEVAQRVKTLISEAMTSSAGPAQVPSILPTHDARIAMSRNAINGALTHATVTPHLPSLRWLKSEHLTKVSNARQLTHSKLSLQPLHH